MKIQLLFVNKKNVYFYNCESAWDLEGFEHYKKEII
jgi:hypothetical protein